MKKEINSISLINLERNLDNLKSIYSNYDNPVFTFKMNYDNYESGEFDVIVIKNETHLIEFTFSKCGLLSSLSLIRYQITNKKHKYSNSKIKDGIPKFNWKSRLQKETQYLHLSDVEFKIDIEENHLLLIIENTENKIIDWIKSDTVKYGISEEKLIAIMFELNVVEKKQLVG